MSLERRIVKRREKVLGRLSVEVFRSLLRAGRASGHSRDGELESLLYDLSCPVESGILDKISLGPPQDWNRDDEDGHRVRYYELIAEYFGRHYNEAEAVLKECATLLSHPLLPSIYALVFSEHFFGERIFVSRLNVFLKGANNAFWHDIESDEKSFRSLYGFLKERVVLRFSLNEDVPLSLKKDFISLSCKFFFYYSPGHLLANYISDLQQQISPSEDVRSRFSVAPDSKGTESDPRVGRRVVEHARWEAQMDEWIRHIQGSISPSLHQRKQSIEEDDDHAVWGGYRQTVDGSCGDLGNLVNSPSPVKNRERSRNFREEYEGNSPIVRKLKDAAKEVEDRYVLVMHETVNEQVDVKSASDRKLRFSASEFFAKECLLHMYNLRKENVLAMYINKSRYFKTVSLSKSANRHLVDTLYFFMTPNTHIMDSEMVRKEARATLDVLSPLGRHSLKLISLFFRIFHSPTWPRYFLHWIRDTLSDSVTWIGGYVTELFTRHQENEPEWEGDSSYINSQSEIEN